MCQPKFWNKIYSEAPEKNSNGETSIALIGERSDFEVIKVEVIIAGSNIQIASNVKRAFDTLESYRDCDCSAKLGSCIKHLDIQLLMQHNSSTVMVIGRR